MMQSCTVSKPTTSLLCQFFETTQNMKILSVIQSKYLSKFFQVVQKYRTVVSIFFVHSFTTAQYFWIGARRICNTVAGDRSAFLWLDKSPMEYQWWNIREPDQAGENCVMINFQWSNDPQNNTWSDVGCSAPPGFTIYPVCQFRLLSRKTLLYQ